MHKTKEVKRKRKICSRVMELRNIKTRYKVLVCEDKKKLNEHRKKIIDSFHFYNRNELRREAMSHYQCVIEELAEEGFPLVVGFFEDLVKDNETLILNDDLGLINRLSDAPKIIDILKEILIKGNAAHSRGDRINECLILREGAHQMLKMDQMKGWMWLIRRMLLISLGISKLEILDGGFMEASSHYTYARFLWEYHPKQDSLDTDVMDDVALKHLAEAKNLSAGKVEWLINEENRERKRSLTEAVCLLMRDIRLNQMYHSKDEGSQISERSYTLAVQRALESGNKEEYAETLTRVGDFLHFVCDKAPNAIEYFNKALDIQKYKSNDTGICDSLYSLSMALERLGYVTSARQHLKDLLMVAEENNIITWQSRALTCLGERDLWSGQPLDASKKFIQAYRIYRNDLISQPKNTPSGLFKSVNSGAIFPLQDKKSYPSNMQMFDQNVISERNMTVRWDQNSMAPQKDNHLTIKEFKEKYLNSHETVGYLSIHRKTTQKLGGKNDNTNLEERQKNSTKQMTECENAESVISDTKSENICSNVLLEHQSSSHSRKLKKHHKKKKKGSLDLSDDDANSDVDIRVQSDINLPDNIHSEDMDYLRCMCGISGGQEIMQPYFEALMQADTSMTARLNIIEWKLSRKPFWKKKTSMVESSDGKRKISFSEQSKL